MITAVSISINVTIAEKQETSVIRLDSLQHFDENDFRRALRMTWKETKASRGVILNIEALIEKGNLLNAHEAIRARIKTELLRHKERLLTKENLWMRLSLFIALRMVRREFMVGEKYLNYADNNSERVPTH